MPPFRSHRRRGAVLALALFASLLSCGREFTGPGGRGALVALNFTPDYSSMIDEVDGVMHSVAALVPFTKVRIELRRVDNSIAAADVVDFPPTATEIPLAINVRLGDAAVDGAEPLTALLRYINADGDTVFAGGPVNVIAKAGRPGQQQPPVEVPVVPTVPGAVFARIDIAPDTVIATSGQVANFTATGFDGQDNVVSNAIIGFISRNPALVAVPSLGSGTVNLVGVRGQTWLVAQSLTGVKDSAFIRVLPRPSTLVKVSGDAQSALTGAAFTQPLRVRVLAADNEGVAGWPVVFTVASGGGSVSADTVLSDINGFAEVAWTAGSTVGPGSVTASVSAPTLSVTFAGTQASTLPTSLAFLTQPANITGGDPLGNIQVEVRNGLGQAITEFAGTVTLSLTGGTAGASLIGSTAAGAVAGVATFSELTVDKGGTAYRLAATVDGVPTAQSNTFNVLAPPPTSIQIVGGAGQAAPPQATLPDSIRVRVLDQFESPVAGATVNFGVSLGGGSVSAASRVTDADGRAGTVWTLGASGPQQLSVSVGQLNTSVSATIVVGGAATLFAGYDYTFVPAGQAKPVPVYLTAPSGSATTVTLTMQNPAVAQWSTGSIEIGAGLTQALAHIDGLTPGTSWAYLSSSLGNDSLLVTVDSASLLLVQLNESEFVPGDTVYSQVRITEPAPPGGVTVLLRALDPSVLLVAPGTGEGNPAPGCVELTGCFVAEGSLRIDAATLAANAADTALIFIPAGQVVGQIAYIANSVGATTIEASAPGYTPAGLVLSVDSGFIYVGWDDALPEFGIAAGTALPGKVYFYQPSSSTTRRLQLSVSNPAIATVDSVAVAGIGSYYSAPITLRALAEGTTYLVWQSASVPRDSVQILVTPRKFALDASTTYLPQHDRGTLYVATGADVSSQQTRNTTAQTFTVRTEPTGILELDRAGGSIAAGDIYATFGFVAVGFGSTLVIVEGPGADADTLQITTYQSTVSTSAPGSTLGVGLRADISVGVQFSQLETGSKTITVTSSNPSVAQVLTPTLNATNTSMPPARIAGVSAGSATLFFSAPGYATSQVELMVAPTTLSLFVINSGLDQEGFDRPAAAYLTASGTAYAPLDTTRGVLRSTNPSVVRVTDSLVTWIPGTATPLGGRYQAMAPGTATLVLAVPGLDSATAEITINPHRLIVDAPFSLGEKMGEPISLWRTGPDNVPASVSIQHQGPGLVDVLGIGTGFVNTATIAGTMVGQVPGVDTVIFTIDGHAPDTAIVTVEDVRVELAYDNATVVGLVDEFVFSHFRPVAGSVYYTPGEPLSLRLTSSDTSVAEVLQDAMVYQADNSFPDAYAIVKYKKSGPALLILEDLGGTLAPDTVEVFVEPRTLMGSSYYSDNTMVMGQRQVTESYEVYVDRGTVSSEPLTVYLTSTDPSVVGVPDSIVIEPYERFAEFAVTSGAAVGSARIVAESPGYNPWQLDVLVTRGRIASYFTDGVVGGRTYHESYVTDAMLGFARRSRDTIPFRLRSSDLTVADTTGASFLFPADSGYVVHEGVLGVSPGRFELGIEDTRSDPAIRYTSSTELGDVLPATLRFGADRFTATPGTRSTYSSQVVEFEAIRDSTWLFFTTKNGNAATVDSILVLRSAGYEGLETLFEDFPLFGEFLGVDTLVVSAAGYLPDTALVYVQQGVIETSLPVLPTIVTGDSVQVTLRLRSPDGASASVRGEPMSLSITNDAGIAVKVGGVTVSFADIDVGDTGAVVWIHGLSPGTHALTVSAATFKPLELRLNVVTR